MKKLGEFRDDIINNKMRLSGHVLRMNEGRIT
jgi:hypothetical protein